MPTFEYQAQAADGHVVNGMVFGVTLDHALRELSAKGMQTLRIGVAANPNDPLAPAAAPAPVAIAQAAVPSQPETARASESLRRAEEAPPLEDAFARDNGPSTEQRSYLATSVWGPLVGQVPLTALQFFFRQGATMFEAGVPAVQALETLSGQSGSAKLTGIIREIAGHVKAGRPISAGMQRYPEVFSPIAVSLVRSGEEGGFVADAMGLVANYLEREIELRNLYKRVTFYPKMQLVLSMIIIIGANAVLASLGTQNRLNSPLTTPATWIALAPLIIGIFLFIRVGLANQRVKGNWDEFIARIPYIGNTIRQISMAKFGRAFGALYKGGVPVQKALLLSADACGNEFLRARMYSAEKALERGDGITDAFKATNAFSPIVIDMVHTGETTGNVDFMLNKMAEYFEQEATTRSIKTGQVTGVVVFLLVAIYIGSIVIGFWSSYAGGAAGGGG